MANKSFSFVGLIRKLIGAGISLFLILYFFKPDILWEIGTRLGIVSQHDW